jgi:hypothetical protein
MSLEINAATARLVREMNTAEETIADALVATAGLLHTAATASREVPEAPVLQAQAALLRLNKMVGSLIEARGEALRVHGQLLDIGREMGATETPYCPPVKGLAADQQKAA